MARIGLWLIAGGCCHPAFALKPGGQIIVLANQHVPQSIELAKYYMEKRDIPEANLCLMNIPVRETISRKLYNLRVRDPLLAFLRKGDFIEQRKRPARELQANETEWETKASSVRYVVSLFGMPLKIADTRIRLANRLSAMLGLNPNRDMAALDSELALLLAPAYDIGGPFRCPWYHEFIGRTRPGGTEHFIMATRLDGPRAKDVKSMIDQAIAAERYGIQGRAYVDIRNIRDTAYFLGDYWLFEAYQRLAREGYEVNLDSAPEVFSAAYPMTSVAFYLGWYTEDMAGPFLRNGFHFQPGAIAYHLHSASAKTLQSSFAYWTGPLIARGACATMGAVYEPYLALTPNIDVFIDRLCMGYTFAESAYMAMPGVSWQITVLGDPLYRPFKYSLDQQIRNLEQDQRPEVVFAYQRKINLMVRAGRFNVAMDYCRRKIRTTDSDVLREKLGDLYARNKLFDEAGHEYEAIIQHTDDPVAAVRVGERWILILDMLDRAEQAREVRQAIIARWPDDPALAWLKASES